MFQKSCRTTRRWNGRRIIIDLADVPFPLGSGLEVMVMYASSGKEIESVRTAGLDEAVKVYQQMLKKYPEDSKSKEGCREEASS